MFVDDENNMGAFPLDLANTNLTFCAFATGTSNIQACHSCTVRLVRSTQLVHPRYNIMPSRHKTLATQYKKKKTMFV